jgi:hypothetical protein
MKALVHKKPAQPVKFRDLSGTDFATHAQSLLKVNKDHLNTEQAQYAQDKNPKSDRWSNLWQAEGKRRAYETQEHQMVDERMRVVEESNDLSTALGTAQLGR